MGSTLVTIKSGSGSRPPLFCVHAEAGDVSLYHGVACRLSPDQPVLGLCAPEPGDLPPHEPLERMAERQVGEIRRAQLHGPYLIVGECTGGALAYEIARQLRSTGEEVALLAIVDAFAPGSARLRWPIPRPVYRMVHRARIMAFHADNMVRLAPRAKLSYAASKAHRAWTALTTKASSGAGRSTAAVSARRGFREATAQYSPEPYDGPIVLYRAARLPLGVNAPDDLGWGALTRHLEVETIPGYFTTAISEPGVRILADRLDLRLGERGGGSCRCAWPQRQS